MDVIESFEALLARGKDNAMLRYGLGTEYRKRGDAQRAVLHLGRAVEHDPDYSAAWKEYGRALADAGRRAEAAGAWRSGIEAAERRGDVQAAREMRVFLRRLEKSPPG